MVSNRDVLQYREKRFLLIDDMENACSMMRSILVSMGFIRTETAHKLTVAETMIRNNHFDVILCDNNMGSGETGQMFMERLRREGTIPPRTVFIIISAETYTGSIFAAVEHQPDAYIAKPFVPATLTEKLVTQIKIKETFMPFYDAQEDGDTDGALAVLRKLSTKQATKTVAQKLLGQKLLELGKNPEARALYQEINERRMLPWSAVGEAEALQGLGDFVEAERILQELIDQNPNAIQGLESLRKLHEKKGKDTDAYVLLKKVCAMNPTNIQRQSDLGHRALGQNDVDTAVSAFKQALRTANGTPSMRESHYAELALGIRKAAQSTHDESKQMSLLQEASFHLGEGAKIFKNNPKLQMHQSLAKAMELANQGYAAKATMELGKAMENLEESGLGESDALDFIETAYFTSSETLGDRVAQMLLQKNPGNKTLQENVRKVQEGPINYHDRAEAARLITEGTEFFADKNWAKASVSFEAALQKAPHSINLRLNLVHVLIYKLKHEFNVPDLKRAKEVMGTIVKLEESHPSYKKQAAFETALSKLEKHNIKGQAA